MVAAAEELHYPVHLVDPRFSSGKVLAELLRALHRLHLGYLGWLSRPLGYPHGESYRGTGVPKTAGERRIKRFLETTLIIMSVYGALNIKYSKVYLSS